MAGFKNLLSNDLSFTQSHFLIRYGVPLVLLLWFTMLKLMYDPIGAQSPYLLYFGLIIITARYFGHGAAIAMTLLSAIIANFFFIVPYFSLTVDVDHIVQSVVFIAECGLIIGLTLSLSKTYYKMRQNDKLYRAMIEKSADGVVLNAADGTKLYCSPSIQNILGYTPDEFLSIEAWKLVHQDEVLGIKEEFYRLASHPGKTVTTVQRIKHKNGNWIWVESRFTNMLNDPMIKAVISNLHNVTERVILEKQRENFIGVASHELKTPLTSLKAYTQVLQNRFKNSEDQTTHSIVSRIDFQAGRIIQMITDLLDLTTLQAGKLNINKTLFDFNALVIDLIEGIQQSAKKHKINIALTPFQILHADSVRISQVIYNLISNAIKYSPDADVINVSSKLIDGQLFFYVTDFGIGVPLADREKIFDRFYRVDYAKNTFQGLGLGLFICSQIIILHDGQIGVDSDEGKGSTFWFRLPL